MARIFITGSSTGLGLAAALSLLTDGHEVILHARNPERASALRREGTTATAIVTGDLSLLADARSIAEQVNALGRVDAVIHNAGLYGETGKGRTTEGHSVMTAVNILAPYVLTALIERPKRLVYMSSGLHRGGSPALDDIDWTKRRWQPGQAYGDTKLQIVALAFAVARAWPDTFSNAVDPGWVRTRMGGSSAPVDIATGQATQSWLASSEDAAARTSGGYWHAMRREAPAAPASDTVYQDRLLAELARLTGVYLGD
ncbi:SDR family NAD(P)-dependent oxidoreductase [Sphingomonas abietis]|uniref:SDR family NAD(P)-dependent oxidoreductase n=1 Tax=Sphingomonas abietis TaxID=3012344 RepID=A0ABY7NJR6_9SPHN|nr:SDR family NAD(P)-dependent oxidoreductase [Sphingomonas abietis]WBO21724.1 SDR family NAD(P)-dependent oxidoreductase [Sphingomonas abietis]